MNANYKIPLRTPTRNSPRQNNSDLFLSRKLPLVMLINQNFSTNSFGRNFYLRSAIPDAAFFEFINCSVNVLVRISVTL